MEDHVMASSSAHDAKSNRRQPRKRADKTAYSMPGQRTPEFAICDQYGPSIEPALIPLARALFTFDFQLFRRVHAVDRKYISSTDEARKTEAVRRMEEFVEIKRQWKDINLSQRQFSQSYMQDDHFVPVWVEGLRIVKEALRIDSASGNQIQKQSDFMRILADYERRACKLRDQMVDTAQQGLLEKEVLYSIQERWIRLDEILDWYYNLCNHDLDEDIRHASRDTPKWQDVRRLVQTIDPRTGSDKERIPIPLAGRPRKATQPSTMTGLLGSKIDGALILWSTLFGCAVTSTAFFALGYAHSPHLQGTTNDADFWFLIQATIMQLLGLVTSAILEQKSGGLPKWRWVVPTAIAGACSIIAIPLYLIVPTE